MTGDSYGFFWDDLGGDRLYSAESMEKWLFPFFTTGVFNGQLQVTADTGMTVSVGSGYANINGKVIHYDTSTSLTLPIASSTNDRIDTIVLERNDSDRIIEFKVIEGTPAATPTAPEPVREDAVYQLVLAHIYVAVGTTAITQADITDKRTDPDLCGYVAATVEEIDFSQITAQWDAYIAEFKADREDSFDAWVIDTKAAYDAWIAANQEDFLAWYDRMKDQLDHDAAGHLQNEIDDIVAQAFKDRYDLASKVTTIVTVNGQKVITETGQDVVAVTTITNGESSKTITTLVTPDEGVWEYVKTTVIETIAGGKRITDSYTVRRKEV